jgi:hypothetical protein
MITIKNLLLLSLILAILNGCHDKSVDTADMDEMPNANTRYIMLNSLNISDNTNLLNSLEQKLHKDHFTFTKTRQGGDTSFINCDNNTVLNIEGKGILSYYVESTAPEKGSMKNTYARFRLTIFTFENEKVAANNHKMIEAALSSSSSENYCNGKGVITLLHRDKTIYYFFPGANMFETHTVKYANYIKNFRP